MVEQNKNEEEQVETLVLDDNEATRILFGELNKNLKTIAEEYGVRIGSRGGEVRISGPSDGVRLALSLLNQLYGVAINQDTIKNSDVLRSARILMHAPNTDLTSLFFEKVVIPGSTRKSIVPKTIAQKQYVEQIRQLDMVFGVGPAGTGKTYLAMAMGVFFLMRKDFKRIVLTRPAVEAGEHLGFLPGDIVQKVNPYLRPLYDALYDMVEIEKAQYWMEQGIVEVAPLAFMRGRTLNDSFIILDEAQNTTPEQMKMFLTRMGFGSKAVITGDITQIDLPGGAQSGLIHATRLLSNIEGIGVSRFTDVDVVRHPLVQRIVRAYDAEANDH
jgi:phosphate starvation-inducible PhoH-like protein